MTLLCPYCGAYCKDQTTMEFYCNCVFTEQTRNQMIQCEHEWEYAYSGMGDMVNTFCTKCPARST